MVAASLDRILVQAALQCLDADLRAYLHAAVPAPLTDDGVVVADIRDYLAKIDREHASQRLRTTKYKANRDKCEFAQQELEYLGHYVTPHDIHPLADKIQTIVDWPEPRTTTDVRSFMGLAGYYQRFVGSYSKVAAPLSRLQSPKARMTPKLTRWATKIDEFDFELKPVKGKYNAVADALSRRSDFLGAIVTYLDVGADLQQKIKAASADDPVYSTLIKKGLPPGTCEFAILYEKDPQRVAENIWKAQASHDGTSEQTPPSFTVSGSTSPSTAITLLQSLSVGAKAMQSVALGLLPAEMQDVPFRECGGTEQALDGSLLLAAGGLDTHVHVYEASLQDLQFRELCVLKGHQDWIRSVDIVIPALQSPPNRSGGGESVSSPPILVASASQDKNIRIWRIAPQEQGKSSKQAGQELSLAMYAAGPLFKLGGRVWQASLESLLVGHEDWVLSVKWQRPQVQVIAVAGESRLTEHPFFSSIYKKTRENRLPH
ncbi:hypothetical protein CBR_g37253 [Chara braunii]|uniref:Elongator complex protein 2 n=1 Tax=Chara braunii TaxID=69332 RepID=A0A388LMI7_CHABU|nr:hypothetical protein CBR_g37253 [Chara braunii]|eukprot:GBG83537.1 hypothetical protein CBR_g37253 [Chara braunii]